MIRFLLDKDNSLKIQQNAVSPAVYLDHWALMEISGNSVLNTRFTNALTSRNGTLMLSWLNLAEFSTVRDNTHAKIAEEFIEKLLPNIFLLEVNPFDVIERENRLLSGGPPVPPHADMSFLNAFSQLRSKTMIKPLTAHRLFTVIQDARLDTCLNDFADSIVEKVESLRETMDNDVDFSSLVKKLPSGENIQRGTRFILRELLGTLLIDSSTKMTRNHGIDLMHSVVPVAYADFVLLDSHWKTQVEKIRDRFLKKGLFVPIANVFSMRKNGLDQFLCKLETV